MAYLKPGPSNSIVDISGLALGNAQNEAVKTGSTVLVCAKPARAGVLVPGGGPGTRETELLSSGRLVGAIDALVLSGGSAFGLAAADGVTDALHGDGRGYALIPRAGVPPTPIVPAAILYDLANGGDKAWGDCAPYYALGRAAYAAASSSTPKLGRAGAGFGAMAGAGAGGLGSASLVFGDYTIAALVAVNSFGSVRIPNQAAFWAAPYEIDAEFGGILPVFDAPLNPGDWGAAKINPNPNENTTLAIIATDAPLTKGDLDRVLQMAQTGMARAIRPVFTPFDGDIIFGLTTAEHAEETPPLDLAQMGELAAQTLSRAIARGVFEAEITDQHNGDST